MNYGSVCSGVEAASLAWEPLGWNPMWFSEIEKFPSQVLKYRFPNVPNLGDMTRLAEHTIYNESDINVLVGGTPCQSFSIAGLRNGLDDQRGNLALEYCRILLTKQPQWFVWENVPGVLSSFSGEAGGDDLEGIGPDNGRDITETSDFATILEAFRECGYSCAYRILDAQYFGVPQRRRRIFVVGYLGADWRPPVAVLFERESLSGDSKKGGKKRKEAPGKAGASIDCTESGISGTVTSKWAKGTGGPAGDEHYNLVAYDTTQITSKANRSNPQPGDPCHTIAAGSHAPLLVGSHWDNPTNPHPTLNQSANTGGIGASNQEVFSQRGGGLVEAFTQNQAGDVLTGEVMHSIGTNSNATGRNAANVVAPLNTMNIVERKSGSNGFGIGNDGDPQNTLTKAHCHGIITSVARRLTPMECERLQGFPDNWTLIPGAKDGNRYKAVGNSMAVPVMRWIGERITKVQKVINSNQ